MWPSVMGEERFAGPAANPWFRSLPWKVEAAAVRSRGARTRRFSAAGPIKGVWLPAPGSTRRRRTHVGPVHHPRTVTEGPKATEEESAGKARRHSILYRISSAMASEEDMTRLYRSVHNILRSLDARGIFSSPWPTRRGPTVWISSYWAGSRDAAAGGPLRTLPRAFRRMTRNNFSDFRQKRGAHTHTHTPRGPQPPAACQPAPAKWHPGPALHVYPGNSKTPRSGAVGARAHPPGSPPGSPPGGHGGPMHFTDGRAPSGKKGSPIQSLLSRLAEQFGSRRPNAKAQTSTPCGRAKEGRRIGPTRPRAVSWPA